MPVTTAKPSPTITAIEAALNSRPAGRYVLRLYVAGASARSRQALLNVREVCEAELSGRYDLEVVDIYQQPSLARDRQIIATPTLVREYPVPVRRLIGDLSDTVSLLAGLGLGTKDRAAR